MPMHSQWPFVEIETARFIKIMEKRILIDRYLPFTISYVIT